MKCISGHVTCAGKSRHGAIRPSQRPVKVGNTVLFHEKIEVTVEVAGHEPFSKVLHRELVDPTLEPQEKGKVGNGDQFNGGGGSKYQDISGKIIFSE